MNWKWTVVPAVALAALITCLSPVHAQNWTDTPDAESPDAKTPPPNLAGSWSGSVNDATHGTQSLSLDITQKKNKIGGTFDIGGGLEDGVLTEGKVNGKKGTVKFRLRVAKNCAPKASADLSNGNTTMTGSYSQSTKHCHASGTFTATLAP